MLWDRWAKRPLQAPGSTLLRSRLTRTTQQRPKRRFRRKSVVHLLAKPWRSTLGQNARTGRSDARTGRFGQGRAISLCSRSRVARTIASGDTGVGTIARIARHQVPPELRPGRIQMQMPHRRIMSTRFKDVLRSRDRTLSWRGSPDGTGQ